MAELNAIIRTTTLEETRLTIAQSVSLFISLFDTVS